MTVFLKIVLTYLLKAAILFACVLPLFFLLYTFYRRYRQKKYGTVQNISVWKLFWAVVFLCYLLFLFYVTFLERSSDYGGYANLHLFRAWKDAWNQFDNQAWLNIILNILMFLPLGFCIPIFSHRFRNWYLPLVIGFLFSGFIELFQNITGKGLCDVDDLLCNTLGALVGGCLILSLYSMKQRSFKRAAGHLLVPVLCCLVFGGAFLTYFLQDYGNMPAAPSYRIPVQTMEWTRGTPPDPEKSSEPVYFTQVMTRQDCDHFAEVFFRRLGKDINRRKYYEKSAVYYAGEDSLHITYLDGAFLYQAYDSVNQISSETDQETLREILEKWSISVPENAVFSREPGGDYQFSAQMLPVGSGVYDGVLRCRLNPQGEILELEQAMIYRAYYGEDLIRSEAQAFEKLKKGDFSGPDWFPGQEPSCYQITDCRIEYRTDTKGYYRPVYIFDAITDEQYVGGGLLVIA